MAHRFATTVDCLRIPIKNCNIILSICSIFMLCSLINLFPVEEVSAFNHSERIQLQSEAKQMFYHAYQSYINTYPADEILPISCRGRYRQVEDSSDIDDSIGNFSLTLVDSLDMLVIMGDIDEFQVAIKKIIRDLNFDMDITVSVFETNIRMLGGLLSAHVLAKSVQDPQDKSIRYLNETIRKQMSWYNSELLDLAEDLGRRLLPAFDTKTGIPHSRVNLKYGLEPDHLRKAYETCTACAGSLILEFATLSRLTGNEIYEEKARGALDALWRHRHRSTDLVGTVINVNTGDWVRRESGVGAGSDSYYEYLMKAYILLGDTTYLHRFNRHYASVMRYISRGPFLIDVHMHRPNRIAKGFMDALSAFWPGLQVLKGDLKAAISTHAMFNEVIRRHSYLPEAFTTDLQVYWANHQMRPEFLESTFFLHRATREDYYLDTGKDILRKLQDLKVDCGFAGLKDVRTGVHDDRMSSFVLAETLKYLYLLFSEDNETHVDLDKYILSTEGHPLPINLALLGKSSKKSSDQSDLRKFDTKKSIASQIKLASNDLATNIKIVPWHDKNSDDITKLRREIRLEKISDQDSLKRSNKQQIPAAVAKLLMKMSDKINQDNAVINFDNYDNSCPSLEAQEMRFDGRYHPFLNERIKPTKTTTSLTEIIDPELLFAIGFKVFYSMSY
jgi:mannosidase alpha-like ER degradation enhancer 3